MNKNLVKKKKKKKPGGARVFFFFFCQAYILHTAKFINNTWG